VLGDQVFWADQTMLNGVDNRHESWEIQTAAQNLFAEALEADQCLFSTNGSTTSVHSAMSAVVGPGEKIALSRNAHKSVITGLIHTGAVPVWLEAEYDEGARARARDRSLDGGAGADRASGLQGDHGRDAELLRRLLRRAAVG
jgi:arginine/lysine/ornithine decarboxylase